MTTAHKIQQVTELTERLQRAVITIGLDYRGLTVAQLRQLRLALRELEPDLELRIVKNTLLQRAAAASGHPSAAALAHEATALLFGYGAENSPAKALRKYMTDARLQIPIHAGYMHGALLTPAEVDELARIPSRVELLGRIAGGLVSPIAGIAGALRETMRELAAVLKAHAAQLDEQPAAPAAEPASDGGAGA